MKCNALSLFALVQSLSGVFSIGLSGLDATGSAAGASYFLTNSPSGNYVVSSYVLSSGQLVFSNVTETRGNGSHVIFEPNAPFTPDALTAQDPLAVHLKKRFLAAVNAGSDTISLFSINEDDPTKLTMIGNPVSSGGNFPNSVVFSEDGAALCALNTGQKAGVNCFAISENGLRTISESARSLYLDQTNPPTFALGTAHDIAFSPNGSSLLVAVGVASGPGYIASWDVQPGGTLSTDMKKIALPSGGMIPFTLTRIPNANALLLADPGVGYDIVDLSNTHRSSANSVSGQGLTCWSTYSNNTRSYYLGDAGSDSVHEVTVGLDLTGSFVKEYPQVNNSSPLDNKVAFIDGDDYLFQLLPGIHSVGVFTLAGPGNAELVQMINYTQPLEEMGVELNGPYMIGMGLYTKT